MKVVILNEYLDKKLNRKVKVGEVLDMDEDRIEDLLSAGIDMEYDEDSEDEELDDEAQSGEDSEDEELDDEAHENGLIEDYKNDKNIVDGLKADDLKILCEAFGVNYSNVGDAKEALKIVTIS